MNRIDSRLRIGMSLALLAIAAARPARADDASDATSATAAQTVPAAPVAAARAQATRDTFAVGQNGNAIRNHAGLITALSPTEFYAAVGRKDLAEGLALRRNIKTGVVVSGALLGALSTVAFFASVVYSPDSCSNTNLDKPACNGFYFTEKTAQTLTAVSLVGVGVGMSSMALGLIALHPDDGGEEERRRLADEYNEQGTKADASAPVPVAQTHQLTTQQLAARSLSTLSISPLVSDQGRGVSLRMSF
jgi:hypothetical protein